jgi:hypothetical protein
MTTTEQITDHDDIDELAVTMIAVDGMRIRLRGRDRDEAIRRMHGRIDTELIAWRLYITRGHLLMTRRSVMPTCGAGRHDIPRPGWLLVRRTSRISHRAGRPVSDLAGSRLRLLVRRGCGVADFLEPFQPG